MRYILLTIITYAYVILMFPLLVAISLIFMVVMTGTKVVLVLTEDGSIPSKEVTDGSLQSNGNETGGSRDEP